MTAAAKNEGGGAPMAFMGMGMAGNMTAGQMTGLYELGQQAPPPGAASNADVWRCACGQEGNRAAFCPACGSPRPASNADVWRCECGAVSQGKFCPQCGKPRPAAALCPRCGYAPPAGQTPPKFCPECGAPFAGAEGS